MDKFGITFMLSGLILITGSNFNFYFNTCFFYPLILVPGNSLLCRMTKAEAVPKTPCLMSTKLMGHIKAVKYLNMISQVYLTINT